MGTRAAQLHTSHQSTDYRASEQQLLFSFSVQLTTKRKPVSIDFVVTFIFCKIDEVFIGQHSGLHSELNAGP